MTPVLMHVSQLVLDKYIPYNISIKASTSAGFGPLTSNWTFTEEGSKSNVCCMIEENTDR